MLRGALGAPPERQRLLRSELSSNLTRSEVGCVDVGVRCAVADRSNKRGEIAGCNTLTGNSLNVCCGNAPGDRPRSWARGFATSTTQKRDNPAIHRARSEVNVSHGRSAR